MKIVAIKEMSVGNSNHGRSWQETEIFDSKESIENVLNWACMNAGHRIKITLTIPDCSLQEFYGGLK